MARIRSIKPEHKTHRKVGQLVDREYRLWIGLITECDDQGRVVCEAEQICAVVFPYQRELTAEQVEDAIQALAKTGLIRLYTVDDVRYAELPSWADHQRIHKNHFTPSKLPAPPGQTQETFGRGPGEVPDMSRRKGSGSGSGSEGKGSTPSGAAAPGFDAFWLAYPKKVAKQDAERAWRKLKPSEEMQGTILKALGLQARSESWAKERGKFIPYPSTWLNGARWADEAGPAPTRKDITSGGQATGFLR